MNGIRQLQEARYQGDEVEVEEEVDRRGMTLLPELKTGVGRSWRWSKVKMARIEVEVEAEVEDKVEVEVVIEGGEEVEVVILETMEDDKIQVG